MTPVVSKNQGRGRTSDANDTLWNWCVCSRKLGEDASLGRLARYPPRSRLIQLSRYVSSDTDRQGGLDGPNHAAGMRVGVETAVRFSFPFARKTLRKLNTGKPVPLPCNIHTRRLESCLLDSGPSTVVQEVSLVLDAIPMENSLDQANLQSDSPSSRQTKHAVLWT